MGSALLIALFVSCPKAHAPGRFELLGWQNLVDSGTARWALPLQCGSTVLHRHALGVGDVHHLPALDAKRLVRHCDHLLSGLRDGVSRHDII